eukprot:COSAG06_NODE_41347_length_392_cov_0.914676_2_plen_80_part_01
MVCAAGLSQDHLQLGGTGGISWGHWASRDFVVRFRVSDGMLPPQSSWPLALTHTCLCPCRDAWCVCAGLQTVGSSRSMRF